MTDASTVTPPAHKQRSMYHAVLLGFMATITGAIVVIGNVETHDVIKQRYAEDMKASLSQVVHPDMYNNEILKDTVTLKYDGEDKKVYRARDNGRVVAAAFQMTTNGYSGPIKIIMGVNASGVLMGVRVLSHTETPGLGDQIEAKKSKWIFAFDSMSFAKLKPGMWKVKKDKGYFDQFTGATITPRAVVKGIKAGMDFFVGHKAEILDQSQSTPLDKNSNSVKPGAEVKHHV